MATRVEDETGESAETNPSASANTTDADDESWLYGGILHTDCKEIVKLYIS